MRITAPWHVRAVRGQSKRDGHPTAVDWVTRDIDDQPEWIINATLSEDGWRWRDRR
jgi:hypothetical protein